MLYFSSSDRAYHETAISGFCQQGFLTTLFTGFGDCIWNGTPGGADSVYITLLRIDQVSVVIRREDVRSWNIFSFILVGLEVFGMMSNFFLRV